MQENRPIKPRNFEIRNQEIFEELSPTLLIWAKEFGDTEFFKPFEGTLGLRRLRILGTVIGSAHGWLLFQSGTTISLYNPYTDAERVLPCPNPDLWINAATMSADHTIYILGKVPGATDREAQVQLHRLLSQSEEWLSMILHVRSDSDIYSPVIHDSRLWWFNRDGYLYACDIHFDEPTLHSYLIFDTPQTVSLLVHEAHLLYVDVGLGFPQIVSWFEIIKDDELDDVLWIQDFNFNGNNVFVVSTKAGMSMPPPSGESRDMIFIGMSGNTDCSVFNMVTRSHYQIKNCQAADHNKCTGIWFQSSL